MPEHDKPTQKSDEAPKRPLNSNRPSNPLAMLSAASPEELLEILNGLKAS